MGGALSFFRATATTLTTATAGIFACFFAPKRKRDRTHDNGNRQRDNDVIYRFHAFFFSFLSMNLLYSMIPSTTTAAIAAQINAVHHHSPIV